MGSEFEARDLVTRLLPVAAGGLREAGVESGDFEPLLEVIASRTASGRTAAAWQGATLLGLEGRLGRERALCAMLERYLEYAEGGAPVHTWPLEGALPQSGR